MNKSETRQLIFGEINTLVANFMYYDRKNDEELTREVLYQGIENGYISIDEIAKAFKESLTLRADNLQL